MRQWCCIDAEGDVGDKGLLGVAFYSDITRDYVTDHDKIKELLLLHASRGYTFIAHNAGYDLPVIFWQLGLNMDAIYYNGRFHTGRWKYSESKTTVELWDTVQMSGGLSLERLGTAIGLHKYPTPQKLRGIDPDHYEWKCDIHDEWECEQCYAVRDAEIAYKYMQSFEETLAQWGVQVKAKLPGNAVEVWKALDNPKPINIRDRRIRELARMSYYGGRVETFKLGSIKPIYCADVVSMYPSCMVKLNFPDPDNMIYVTHADLEHLNKNIQGVADVDIDIPYMYVPPLPFAYNDERVFPYGKLRGCWTLNELRYAMSLGCTVTKIHQLAFSTTTVRPFDTFVGVLWEMKKEYKAHNDPREVTAKILLNSLYGRIGMNTDTNEHELPAEMSPELRKQLTKGNLIKERIFLMPKHTTLKDWVGCEVERVGDQLWVSERIETYSHNKYANVLWAAMITAEARITLHRYLMQQGDSAVYCDTDSVFSSAPINAVGEGLGALELTGEYMEGLIAGPKLYSLTAYDGEVHAKAKGVPRNLALRFLQGEEVSFMSPVRPRSQMAKGVPAGTWIEIKRERHLTPHKRQPTNPYALESGSGSSDTMPLFIGSEASLESDD